MTTKPAFPHTGFLLWLEQALDTSPNSAPSALSPALARLLLTTDASPAWTPAAGLLPALLKAREATLQAAHDTTVAADELRRYQKYAKPGKPSAHTVQLRQRQAAARQATNTSRQALNKAALAFVREAGLQVPEREPMDAFIIHWLDGEVPRDAGDVLWSAGG